MQHKRQKRRPVPGSQYNYGQLGFDTMREKGEYIWLGDGVLFLLIYQEGTCVCVCLPCIMVRA